MAEGRRMKQQSRAARVGRWVLGAAVAATVVAGGGGCSQSESFTLNPFRSKHVHTEELSQAEWGQLRRENQFRLAGEGIPADPASTRAATTRPANETQEFFGFVKFAF